MTVSVEGFGSVPVNRLFGFELKSADGGAAAVGFRPGSAHAQEYGVVHGGIISTLADTAAVYTILPDLAADERMTSIEFKINFLGGAVVERGEVTATARLVRKGRTVAVAQVDVRQGEAQVATGLFTYIILRG
jgi:uncharacterized protein (TIGR00369 family)